MHVFPEAERLVVRAFADADAEHLFALDNDPEVMRFINGGKPASRETIQAHTLPRLLHDYPRLGTRGHWTAEEKAVPSFLRNFTGDRPEAVEGSEHGEVEYELTRTDWEQRR